MTLASSLADVGELAEEANSFEIELDPDWRWIGPVPGFVASVLLQASERRVGAPASAISVEFSRRTHSPSVQIHLQESETNFAFRTQDMVLQAEGQAATRATTTFPRERTSRPTPVSHVTKPDIAPPEDVPTIEDVLGTPFPRQGIVRHFQERPLDWLDGSASDPNHDLSGAAVPASFRSWFTLDDGSAPTRATVRAAAMIIAEFTPFLAAKRAHAQLMNQGLQIVASTSSIQCDFYPFEDSDLTMLCCAESPWTYGQSLVGRVSCFTRSMEPILVAQTRSTIAIR